MLQIEEISQNNFAKLDTSKFVGEKFKVVDEWKIGRCKMKKGDILHIFNYGSQFIKGYFEYTNKRLDKKFRNEKKEFLEKTKLINTPELNILRKVQKTLISDVEKKYKNFDDDIEVTDREIGAIRYVAGYMSQFVEKELTKEAKNA